MTISKIYRNFISKGRTRGRVILMNNDIENMKGQRLYRREDMRIKRQNDKRTKKQKKKIANEKKAMTTDEWTKRQ